MLNRFHDSAKTATRLTIWLVAGIMASILSSAIAAPQPATDDCSAVTIPDDIEINTVLDKTAGTLSLSFYDEGLGTDRELVVDYRDPRCRANEKLQAKIDHALAVDAVSQRQICESMAAAVRNNVAQDRGQPVNVAAGRRYLREWCSQ